LSVDAVGETYVIGVRTPARFRLAGVGDARFRRAGLDFASERASTQLQKMDMVITPPELPNLHVDPRVPGGQAISVPSTIAPLTHTGCADGAVPGQPVPSTKQTATPFTLVFPCNSVSVTFSFPITTWFEAVTCAPLPIAVELVMPSTQEVAL